MKTRSHKFLKAVISAVLTLAMVFSVCIPASAWAEQDTESITELTVGATTRLKPSGWNIKVDWSSDDENVVTVSNKGVVTAVGAGEATVTATARSLFGRIKTTEFHIVVNQILPDITLETGESTELEVGVSGTTTWATSDENIATVDNGTVTGISEGIATITATTSKKTSGIFWLLSFGRTTKIVTTFVVEVINPESPSLPEGSTGSVVTNPVEGIAYKFYMKQMNLNKILYLDGGIDHDKYYTTTTDYSEAIDIYAESVNDGYKFYTEIDGVKKYIDLYFNDEGKTPTRYADTTENIFKYNSSTFAWETTMEDDYGDDNYYIGTYNAYATASASKTAYITPENTRISEFPLELTTEQIPPFPTDDPSDPPVDPNPGEDSFTAPVANKAYKLQASNSVSTLYFSGEIKSGKLGATTDKSKAADVFVEVSDGKYYIYYIDAGVKTYIAAEGSYTFCIITYTDKPASSWTFDTASGAFLSTDNNRFIGGNKTNANEDIRGFHFSNIGSEDYSIAKFVE